MNKQCTQCYITKPITEFFRKKSIKHDGRDSRCKQCDKLKRQKYRSTNHGKTQNSIWQKSYNEDRRQLIQQIKIDYGCFFCGLLIPEALDFHHILPKSFNISQIGAHGKSAILDEIAKCICVCANCHRQIHSGRIQIPDTIMLIDTSKYRKAHNLSEPLGAT